MVNKQDSNRTGLAYAEEESLKTLPTTPIWKALDPNTYADFGGDITTVARNPINPSRQKKKGVVTDLDASGGFNTDVTMTNLLDLMQGFFFADALEKASTQPLNGTTVALTNVDGTGEDYEAASGLAVFKAGDLIRASGFSVSANNGLKRVTAAVATGVTVAEGLSDETPASTAKLEAVGFQFPSGDIDIAVSTDAVSLSSSTTDFTTLGLIPGEWVFLGGDTAPTRFVGTAPGYARVKSVAANLLEFDDTTFTASNETGTSLTIQIFFGTVFKNQNTSALIKRRSYQLERQLGEDNDGVMSEYVVGAIPNELKLNIPQAALFKADLSFVGLDNEQRTGATGIKSGTRVSAASDDGINTSSDVYRQKLMVVGTAINPDPLFAYVTESEISVKNNVTPSKAVGVLGAFDVTAGDFEVTGSLTAYFASIEAIQAVRNNSDVAFNSIITKLTENKAMIFDIPLLALGGGKATIEKDTEVKVPLELMGAENDNGYTLLFNSLPYVPTVGMSS